MPQDQRVSGCHLKCLQLPQGPGKARMAFAKQYWIMHFVSKTTMYVVRSFKPHERNF